MGCSSRGRDKVFRAPGGGQPPTGT